LQNYFIHSYQILNNNKDYQVLMRGPNMPARNSTPPFWKNGYISNRRTDFDEVWHGDAHILCVPPEKRPLFIF